MDVKDSGFTGILGKPKIVLSLILASLLFVFFDVYSDLFLSRRMFTQDAITWYGSFHYYVESLLKGQFPYWDPYMMSGTFFYPNMSLLGLLDPAVLVGILIMKVFSVSPVTIYLYFHITRLAIFGAGAFYLFRHISRSSVGALLSAGTLVLAVAPVSCHANGAINVIYLTPFALLSLLSFIEQIETPRRYVSLLYFVLLTGITMNVYIPAYFLFNATMFLVAVLVLGIVKADRLLVILRDRRLLLSVVGGAVLVLMMMAPPLAVMGQDSSTNGELFPMVRILQKNSAIFKKIIASDVAVDTLSENAYDRRAMYSSYGNMVNLLYPDLTRTFQYWAEHDFMSDNDQYVGILSLVLCFIGLLYSRSRYRYVALIMLILLFVNMFSFTGFYARPHNIAQRIFNTVFPALKMIEVREAFGSFFLLYLCMLMSLGAEVILDPERLRDLVSRHRYAIIGFCLGIVGIKVFLSAYFGDAIIAMSLYDLFAIAQLLLCVVAVLLLVRRPATSRIVLVVLCSFLLIDLYAYNRALTEPGWRGSNLQDSRDLFDLTNDERNYGGVQDFQYFRYALAAADGPAFDATILKKKGALTYGSIHAIFSTRRYYDFITHIPVPNQIMLSGVVMPILRFFPEQGAVMINDRHALLNSLAKAPEMSLENALYIERMDGSNEQERRTSLKELAAYEDVPELGADKLYASLAAYRASHDEVLNKSRRTLVEQLDSNSHSILVKEFTPNGLRLEVHNSIRGYLFYADGWSRYWRAFDGEREIPIYKANYLFKAILLEPGAHDLRMEFDPIHYRVALMLYYLALGLTVLLISYLAIRRSPVS